MPLQVPPEIAAAIQRQLIQEQEKYSAVFQIFKILLPIQLELGVETVIKNALAITQLFHDMINKDREECRKKSLDSNLQRMENDTK